MDWKRKFFGEPEEFAVPGICSWGGGDSSDNDGAEGSSDAGANAAAAAGADADAGIGPGTNGLGGGDGGSGRDTNDWGGDFNDISVDNVDNTMSGPGYDNGLEGGSDNDRGFFGSLRDSVYGFFGFTEPDAFIGPSVYDAARRAAPAPGTKVADDVTQQSLDDRFDNYAPNTTAQAIHDFASSPAAKLAAGLVGGLPGTIARGAVEALSSDAPAEEAMSIARDTTVGAIGGVGKGLLGQALGVSNPVAQLGVNIAANKAFALGQSKLGMNAAPGKGPNISDDNGLGGGDKPFAIDEQSASVAAATAEAPTSNNTAGLTPFGDGGNNGFWGT